MDNDGLPTAVYTGVGPQGYGQQSQCIATSQDGLLTWEKYGGNPILSEIPAISNQQYDLRDPMIWREGDAWYMLLASRIKDRGGSVFLYRSPDLIEWEFLHPLLTGAYAIDGCVWECPSLFPLADKWVLIVAGKGRRIPFTVFYFIGDYVDQQFKPETSGILDHAYFYAPFTMEDARGRRLLWGWLREGRSEEAHVAAGWAGCHSIPRELSLRDGRLYMKPVPELKRLRGEPTALSDFRLTGGDRELEIRGSALDIELEMMPEGRVGLDLRLRPGWQRRHARQLRSRTATAEREPRAIEPGAGTRNIRPRSAARSRARRKFAAARLARRFGIGDHRQRSDEYMQPHLPDASRQPGSSPIWAGSGQDAVRLADAIHLARLAFVARA